MNYYAQDFNTGLLTGITDQNASSITDTAHLTSYLFDAAGRLYRCNLSRWRRGEAMLYRYWWQHLLVEFICSLQRLVIETAKLWYLANVSS